MDPDLENVIRQALGDALAAGKDRLGQTELAVQAVQRARTADVLWKHVGFGQRKILTGLTMG